MEEKKDIYILAIESSCDETAAAVVKNGREVLSNVISSQIDLHTLYGGVVPEIASRKHVENIDGVIKKALADAGMTLEEMDAIGVTYGPGLVGALLVGLAEAKAIAYAAGKPLIGVHHIEGHICANYIQNKDFAPPIWHWWFRADIPIWFMFPITGSMKLWDIRETMRQARPMIRLRARLAWGIPEVRRLMRRRRRATPMQ